MISYNLGISNWEKHRKGDLKSPKIRTKFMIIPPSIINKFIYFSDTDWWFVQSFLILGIMVVICAILFGSFTIETCITLKRAIARVQDKEIDEIKNLEFCIFDTSPLPGCLKIA